MSNKRVNLTNILKNKFSSFFKRKHDFPQSSRTSSDENAPFDETGPIDLPSLDSSFESTTSLHLSKGLGTYLKTLTQQLTKFNYEKIFKTLFDNNSRPIINNIFIISLLLSLTYFVGKTTALLLHPKPSLRPTPSTAQLTSIDANPYKSDLTLISQNNPFKIKTGPETAGPCDPSTDPNCKKPIAKKQDTPVICLEATTQSSLPIKLLNTIVLQDSIKSIASVQVRSTPKSEIFREGDKIQSLANIGKIIDDKIVIKNLNSNTCEYVQIARRQKGSTRPPIRGQSIVKPKPHPSIQQDGDKFSIEKKYVQGQLKNMTNILTEARAIQMNNPDGSLCFKMTEVKPGSVYTQLDIQENDIICEINGKKITNLNELMRLFGQLQNLSLDQFEIGLKRGGVDKNLEYNLK